MAKTLDLGRVKGDAFKYSDFTAEQLAALTGPEGPKGPKGDPGEVTLEQFNQLSQQMANYRTAVNLLDNSDFRNPVNQRGQTSYAEDGYTIDRWEMWIESGIANVSLMEGYIAISFEVHGSFYQKLAKGVLDLSKQYSLAIKKHDGSLMVYPAYITSNADNDLITLADLRDGDTMEIEWCALYEGEYTTETLPPYVPKGYAAELAECRRRLIPLKGRHNCVAYTSTGLLLNIFSVIPLVGDRIFGLITTSITADVVGIGNRAFTLKVGSTNTASGTYSVVLTADTNTFTVSGAYTVDITDAVFIEEDL